MTIINMNLIDGRARTNPFMIRDACGSLLWGLHFVSAERAQAWIDAHS